MDASISIVIRTFNSAATLERVLAQLDLREKDEIIIVDSGSTDSTLEIAQRFPCKILRLDLKSFSYGRALNMGFEQANGDWILALSSHCIPFNAQYLDCYHSVIQKFPTRVACAIAPMVYCRDDWYQRAGITLFSAAEVKNHIPGGNTNALYRKTIWLEHRFNEDLPSAEDHEWILWAVDHGYELAMVHSCPVLYEPHRSFKTSFLKGRWDRYAARSTKPLFRHDFFYWSGQTLLKVFLGKISISLFIHIIAQRLGSLSYHWFKGNKNDQSK